MPSIVRIVGRLGKTAGRRTVDNPKGLWVSLEHHAALPLPKRNIGCEKEFALTECP